MTVFGTEIFRDVDEFGPVQVLDDGERRILMFGENDEQGCVLSAQPELVQYSYIRAMLLVRLFLPLPGRCLLLGLGSGALVHSLMKQLPDASLDVVELRKLVIRLARSHFALPRHERLRMHCADAGRFVALTAAEPTYDVIFGDIYHAKGMDEQQGEVGFLDHCRNLLTADGWLVMNYWVTHQRLAGIGYIKSQFEQVWVNNIDGENWIVMASNSTQRVSQAQLQREVRSLSLDLGFSLQSEFLGLTRQV